MLFLSFTHLDAIPNTYTNEMEVLIS